jgi:hypothetical protein
MILDMPGIRAPLLLVASAALLFGCLETTPIEQCLEIAEDDPLDEIELVQVYDLGSHEECPKEGARAVKDAAKHMADSCLYGTGAKLDFIACGPLEERADASGTCEYVAVYNKYIGQCWTE